MKHSLQNFEKYRKKMKYSIILTSIISSITAMHTASAGPVHAFYADEHNTTPTSPTGNRIIEIDLDTMSQVNTLNVPGILGHHADNGFNSKLYGVPKGSGFVNIIELSKDQSGTTSMQLAGQINLTHMPRSGDAYNKKYNIILMAAANRPMGSFINVETDQVVGTIGENVDCTLIDGTRLLSHADANTIAGATKYQCSNSDHGGTQVSGHPYWLTPDHAAIVDRTNNQISVYTISQVGNQIRSTLLNHLPTRTSIHQIIPRDRTNLPVNEQADFYATEEGRHANATNYSGGIAHALLKMKLTNGGLRLVSRMDLQRTQILPKAKADRILNACISIYRTTFNQSLTGPNQNRENQYNALFVREGITRSTAQDAFNDFPIDCFYPGIPGGHNADFAPNNKHLYVPMAGGAVSIVDVNRWKIANNIDIGIRSGVGHMCFSAKHDVALSSNHGNTFGGGFGGSMTRTIRFINSERPIGYYWIKLPFPREGLTTTYQSHTCHVDRNEDFYYNFFTDGGTFYKIDLAGVFNNPTNGSDALVVGSLYTGGIPIQGSYIDLDDIKLSGGGGTFTAVNDAAQSNGTAISINVLQNDTGPNLILEAVDSASDGVAQIVNGQISYTPNLGFSGVDSFWYGVSSNGSWEWALVTVTVTSVVPPPTLKANKDEVSTTSNTATTIDVLANDTGTGLTIGWHDSPANGTMTLSNGKLIYTSTPGFAGTEDLWYEVIDSSGQTTWGHLVITVSGGGGGTVNANNDTATVKLGNTVAIDVLNNDTGTGLTIFAIDDVWTGSVSIANGKIEYIASGNVTGSMNVWYGITDVNGNEDWGMITINMTP